VSTAGADCQKEASRVQPSLLPESGLKPSSDQNGRPQVALVAVRRINPCPAFGHAVRAINPKCAAFDGRFRVAWRDAHPVFASRGF
jgi:hypothetical protein